MSFQPDTYKTPTQSYFSAPASRHHLYDLDIDAARGNVHPILNGSKSMQVEPAQDQGVLQVSHSEANASSTGSENLLPLPDWPTAIEKWGVWWDLHVYGFSVLFILLTLVSCGVFLRFRSRVQKFKIVFNTLIFLATSGVLRAVFMLVDPYGCKGQMATLVIGILTQSVYPLFCACYGLTQVMLLRITKVDVGNSKVRSLSWLMGCTLTYLFLVVVIESLVSFERSLKLLLLVDSGCFIAWSLYLGITFICSGFRLSQYADEAKRARKELNAFNSHRRSASNTTNLMATTLSTNVGEESTMYNGETDLISDNTATSDMFVVAGGGGPYSPTAAASKSGIRLSRPKLKISDKNHMMVTIASDDDDVSTSSTDVENIKGDVSHPRRTRKRYRQKRNSNVSKGKATNSSYVSLSITAESNSNKRSSKNKTSDLGTGATSPTLDTTHSVLPLSTVESVESYNIIFKGGVSHLPFSHCKNNHLGNSHNEASQAQDQQLPLLQTPDPSSVGTLNIINEVSKRDEVDSLDDDIVEDDGDDKQTAASYGKQAVPAVGFDKSTDNTESFMETDFLAENCVEDTGDRSCCAVDPKINHRGVALSELVFSVHSENNHLSNSPRDNGYLADTENIFYCSSLSKVCGSSGRTLSGRDDSGQPLGDMSSQRSTPTHSDDDSVLSPALSERMQSIAPAALGLFRIRQSKMVQRAVHMTYLLTFLFMFACLLQLYTVFGVYGVLGTIPRPDPWPWLIFHSIFRATEVSIGVTTVFIAFLTLNHRHQRAKRRQQQQTQQQQQIHGDLTRDCIV
ncbi:uncharacterized protein LOC106077515 [Biomphalaria glabrata]|uniref:Uncharacterized protein LOC106077515 n=1 Tax=Biomphalaria glabrata TaxID=6526 RepID=A0A9W2YPU9_BIOGL|nr:uncharacterized protein LOC106077515 [Biomphalaria glabrata]XP_055864808.1 uncharacterized protein LOC106077515 [Biomphalaria glabrata]XP_055864809.1 uncharacterized protein LOC106077515 [Biomphalaria glabrata]XP_055864810.1 uncharacterized protein LOC106077515 [Biomphalaria glabrata]XP_055864811.1 uncharacterized protein LOC106077515 [Biomphalaria glabrata]